MFRLHVGMEPLRCSEMFVNEHFSKRGFGQVLL